MIRRRAGYLPACCVLMYSRLFLTGVGVVIALGRGWAMYVVYMRIGKYVVAYRVATATPTLLLGILCNAYIQRPGNLASDRAESAFACS